MKEVLFESISLTLKAENKVYISNPLSAGFKAVEIIAVICTSNSRACFQVTGYTRMICDRVHETRHLALIGAIFPFHFLTKTARLCFRCHSLLLFSLMPQIYLYPYSSYFMGKSRLISYMTYFYIKFKILVLLVHVAASLVTRLDSCMFFRQITVLMTGHLIFSLWYFLRLLW